MPRFIVTLRRVTVWELQVVADTPIQARSRAVEYLADHPRRATYEYWVPHEEEDVSLLGE